MPNREAYLWSRTLAVLLLLIPRVAPAQPIANSFEELRRILKKGQAIVVTDASGQRRQGRVEDVSASALVVLMPDRRTFTEGTVTEIRASDPLSNGALIGAAIGTGLATWDYLIDPSEPGNAAVFTVAIALGTAVGTAIDAFVKNGTILYTAPGLAQRLRISPVLGKDRQGVMVSVSF